MLTVIVILVAVALVWKFTPNPANKRAAGMMFQMLESFHIIDTTVNLDIFTQRLDLLSQLASTLPANAYSDEQQKYIDCIHGELARLSGSTSLHPL